MKKPLATRDRTAAAYHRAIQKTRGASSLGRRGRAATSAPIPGLTPKGRAAVALPDPAAVVAVRGESYGNFADQCKIIDGLMGPVSTTRNWNQYSMKADQREALHMIVVKISRILNGDPNHLDSWVDIAGYATLVVDRLKQGIDNQIRGVF